MSKLLFSDSTKGHDVANVSRRCQCAGHVLAY